MSVRIEPCEKTGEITKLICPDCGEKVKGVVLLKGSFIDGLAFRCGRCRGYKKVRAEPDKIE